MMAANETTEAINHNREADIASLMRTLNICRSEAEHIWNDVASDGDDGPMEPDNDETDCGLLPNGQCLLAGSEWCDWDCGKLR